MQVPTRLRLGPICRSQGVSEVLNTSLCRAGLRPIVKFEKSTAILVKSIVRAVSLN